MNQFLSKIAPWMTLALLALLITMCIIWSHTKPDVLYNTQTIKEIRNDSVQHWRDVAGREHARVQVAESNLATLQAYYGPLFDSVTRALKIQGNKLDALTALGKYTSGTVKPNMEVVRVGEKEVPHFTYSDKWLQLEGVITPDSPYIKYQTFDSLVLTTYSKRKWLLGPSATYVDAYSLNPSSHISGLTGLKIMSCRPKRFGVGPYIGFGYNGQRWQPSAGISLQYSLIKF